MATTEISIAKGDWTEIGTGSLLIQSKSYGIVYLKEASSKPTATDFGHLIGSKPEDGAVQINAATKVWARAELETEQIIVTPIAPVGNGFEPPPHDYIALTYTGSNLTGVAYKLGGSSGTTVATLTLTYDGSNNLTSVTRS